MIAALAMTSIGMTAQETYENAKIAGEDLNGTARYVGMGGAMEALGADISTISTNPAGIGLFRKSNANLSFGFVSQQDAKAFANGHKTNMSFDQIGFVYSNPIGEDSYLNFAFNYHKSRNFDFILSAADNLNNASQNKLTYAKAKNEMLFEGSNGAPNFDRPYIQCNQLDDIYARGLLYDPTNNTWFYDNALEYTMDRAHSGYIGRYDFNLSGNVHNRVYWGITVGISGVHYKHYSEYVENIDNNYFIQVQDDRKITGTGADIKAGIIFRPIEESPFRVGLSISTPTWYDLTTSNYTTLSDLNTLNNTGGSDHNGEEYDFKLYTPWKFGLSLGHTIDNWVALGASYEYADYGHLDSRYITDSHYDWWYDDYTDRSESDEVMNRHTSATLRGVHTLKLGAEFKPSPELAVRFGYNYVSPMYEKDGFKDGTLDSEGSYYSSATDFTNWEATNRITCGLGYQIGKLNLSAAYQYSSQNGNFQPFMSYVDNQTAADDNIANEVKVSNKRHQLLVTLNYTF